jgi:ATP adenylyltransferase
MERLWAPWRGAYVTGSGGSGGCIFCNLDEPGRDELILVRGRVSFVILNPTP